MAHKFYGYIEGYYGRMLTWEERLRLLNHLKKLSLNAYLYAPKQDPYHRQEWRAPYPREWISRFRQFTLAARKKNIRVIPAIAPGLSFDYCSNADYKKLTGKIQQIISCGSRDCALLMDDISEELPKNCVKYFTSLGRAHGKLVARLSLDLAGESVTLWFCPTIYANSLIKEKSGISRYLVDLSLEIPNNFPLLWTGPNIVSKSISGPDLKTIAELFKDNLVIWDNLYANDYCPSRLFLGPFKGRNRSGINGQRGLMLNTTGMPLTDCFYLSLMAAFLRGESARQSWRKTLSDFKVPKEFFTIAAFFGLPSDAVNSKRLDRKSVRKFQKAVDYLLWQWKSPLQCEWYPFLFAFANDLKLVQTPDRARIRGWIVKKYPPLLANALLGQ
ncbi:MAG: beta-N-acetylglucosaminidase domain-containing protein [Chitinivibrionales bacterium]|nr:beta-N-acetylglucosaminidase domain-containing protein [Chitinivibrionales bacterium]